MRISATKVIYEAALKDKNIVFITGDLGHTFAKDYQKNISEQYINVGLAEQNMIGMAAGLALSGKKVFVFSIIPFITMRCFEQIRVDVCYQNLDVSVIGIGAGLAYSTSGCTHHAIEDIAIMRALPNMKIYSPCHPLEAGLLAQKILKVGGPAYLRLGKGKETPIAELTNEKFEDIETGQGIVVHPGHDITIFSTGHIITEAISVAKELEYLKWSTEVINVHTLKPFDRETVMNKGRFRKAIFSLEEHTILGGLGSMIAETISELGLGQNHRLIFKRFGIQDRFTPKVGTMEILQKDNGIDKESLVKEIKFLLHY